MNITEKAVVAAQQTKEALTAYGVAMGDSPDETLADLETKIFDADISEVRICFHSPTASIALGKLNISKDISNSDYDEFVEKAGSVSKIYAFPVFDKKIDALERKFRNLLKRCCIGNTFYMLLSTYESTFLPRFVELTQELDELKSDLSDEYDELISTFSEEARGLVGRLSLPESQRMQIEGSIEFLENRGKNSFLSGVGVELFSGFDSEKIANEKLRLIAKTAKQSQTARMITSIIKGSLTDAFDASRSFVCNMNLCKSGLMADCPRLSEKLKTAAERCELGNFGNADVVRITAEKLKAAANYEMVDDAAELVIALMADIFGVAENLGFSDELKKSYFPEDITPDFLLEEYADRKSSNSSFF